MLRVSVDVSLLFSLVLLPARLGRSNCWSPKETTTGKHEETRGKETNKKEREHTNIYVIHILILLSCCYVTISLPFFCFLPFCLWRDVYRSTPSEPSRTKQQSTNPSTTHTRIQTHLPSRKKSRTHKHLHLQRHPTQIHSPASLPFYLSLFPVSCWCGPFRSADPRR